MTRHLVLYVCLTSLLLLLVQFSATAQQTTRPTPRMIPPSPQAVLGFAPGTSRTIADWGQITDYFARLDKASDRVLVKQIGESTLNRPIIAAFISSRENLLSLPRYQAIQKRLADPRTIVNELEQARLLTEGRTVVVISCSIHSTEIVASQMSMQLAFELASASDPETREILQNTILILIPSPNPDGIDIVAKWYRKTLGTPYEGTDPPELYHHYAGHDDNRDWFMLNLKETRAVSRLLWKEWFPQIVYDVHQQGARGPRFFVPPFYDPPNPHIAPELLRGVGLIGHKIASDLQAVGFQGVITNAGFDTWWHGGFRTAPYFHNSIGILSEAASAKLMTPAKVTREELARETGRGMRNALEFSTNFPDPWPGGDWTPRKIMDMEMVASRSILSLAAKYRANFLRTFLELGKKNLKAPSAEAQPIAYLIPAGQARDEAVAKLINALIEQGVEVHRLDQELHAAFGPQVLQRMNSANENLGTYRMIIAHTSGVHEVPAGSYIIFLSQPQRQNILALFEPQIYPNRVNALGEAERPYDVAGWTLPMQMGVEAPAVVEIQELAVNRRLTLITDVDEVRRDLALPLSKAGESPIKNPVKSSVRVGIYRSARPNMDEGWTRLVFDTFNIPYRSVVDQDVRKGDLGTDFDVLILPSQPARQILDGHAAESYPPEFTGGLSPNGVRNLKAFVEEGGTLVCFDASCDVPIKQFNLPLRNVLEGLRSSEFYCPGSILSLDLERGHPIARGLQSNVDAYFINSSAFEATGKGVTVIARYAKDNLLRSGWLLGENKLRGGIALAETPLGKGRVILFGFRPQHRGQTWGTFPFIWNALNEAKP